MEKKKLEKKTVQEFFESDQGVAMIGNIKKRKEEIKEEQAILINQLPF